MSKNYVEGLEWVYKYYKGEKTDKKWKYEYNNVGLLKDIEEVIVKMSEEEELIKEERKEYSEEAQMIYVMPCETLKGVIEGWEEVKGEERIEELEYEWSYSRYMWESKIKMKRIEREKLDEWETERRRKLCDGGLCHGVDK